MLPPATCRLRPARSIFRQLQLYKASPTSLSSSSSAIPPCPSQPSPFPTPTPSPPSSQRNYSSSTSSRHKKLNTPIDFNTSTLLAHTSSAALANVELAEEVRKGASTKKLNLFQAVNDALATVLERDEKACVFGEDVAFGGVFRCTQSLSDRFGSQRVFNTPLTEQGILGFAIGMASHGHTALPEIQFADYVFPAFDQLHNEASKIRYRSGGATSFNSGKLVVRMPSGAVGHGGLYHSQSPEGFFAGCQGLTVVIPRSPVQAKGLLLAAAEGNDPVVFMEPKILYRAAVEHVPTTHYTLPLNKAEIVTPGDDITVVTYGTMTYVCEAAVAHIKREMPGVSVELIDLRTVRPWDKETVAGSVSRTGRCVVVHEASRTGGIGEGVASEVAERCFLRLEAPVERVTGWDTHMPLAFEQFMVPDVVRVYDAIKKTLEF